MYKPRGYTGQLMLGLAEYISQSGLAVLRMGSGSGYLPGERGIYFETSPALDVPNPVETLVISPYLTEPGRMNIEATRVQIRMRHVNRGRLEIRDLMDQVRGLFPERQTFMFGGHCFDRVEQQSATSWAEPNRTDVSESSQNFLFRGNRYQP